MKIQKRIMAFALSAAMTFTAISFDGWLTAEPVMAEESQVELSGACGESASYQLTLNADKKSYSLSISGSGATSDYTYSSPAPWHGLDVTSVSISDGITSIGEYFFYECGFESVDIPTSVTSMGAVSFSETGLKTITIGDNITSMGVRVFESCQSLESAAVGSGLTGLPDKTFDSCPKFTSVTLPETETFTELGESAFFGCDLSQIDIPDSVTVIGSGCFGNNENLKSLVIPYGVTVLNNHICQNCTSLSYVEIPYTVTTIVDYAFLSCPSLTNVYLSSNISLIGDSWWTPGDSASKMTIHTVSGSYAWTFYWTISQKQVYGRNYSGGDFSSC